MWHVFEHDNDLGVSNVFGVRRGLKVMDLNITYLGMRNVFGVGRGLKVNNGFEHYIYLGMRNVFGSGTWVESEQWICRHDMHSGIGNGFVLDTDVDIDHGLGHGRWIWVCNMD